MCSSYGLNIGCMSMWRAMSYCVSDTVTVVIRAGHTVIKTIHPLQMKSWNQAMSMFQTSSLEAAPNSHSSVMRTSWLVWFIVKHQSLISCKTSNADCADTSFPRIRNSHTFSNSPTMPNNSALITSEQILMIKKRIHWKHGIHFCNLSAWLNCQHQLSIFRSICHKYSSCRHAGGRGGCHDGGSGFATATGHLCPAAFQPGGGHVQMPGEHIDTALEPEPGAPGGHHKHIETYRNHPKISSQVLSPPSLAGAAQSSLTFRHPCWDVHVKFEVLVSYH